MRENNRQEKQKLKVIRQMHPNVIVIHHVLEDYIDKFYHRETLSTNRI